MAMERRSPRYELSIDASGIYLADVEKDTPVRKFTYNTLDQAISVANIVRFALGHEMLVRSSGALPHSLERNGAIQVMHVPVRIFITRTR